MKNNRTVVFGFVLLLAMAGVYGCKSQKKDTLYLGVETKQIETQMNNLLQNFYPRIMDTINGGYWTNFENDWTLSKEQDKMLVTQARGLWTASKACEMFPDNALFRKAADHGYQFLTTQMWDTIHGGFFQYYYTDSAVKTDAAYKQTYANAFALYGLSQYARINKEPEVLEWVKKAFGWLETTVHDSVYGGYLPVHLQNKDAFLGANWSRYWGNPGWKDQNTSIHLLEAFTVAYQVLPEEAVKTRLKEMLELVRDSITSSEGYLNLYFEQNWKPVSFRDSSRKAILENISFDHISFGHNIETAFLLVEASESLYGKPDSVTLKIAKKLIDHTLNYGFDKDYYGLCDKGYQFGAGSEVEILDSTKVWWAQAEAWHALALFSKLYPDEKRYQEGFVKMWDYINQQLIDPEYGGWYNSGKDKNPETIHERKVQEWKSCYHDGRALMQVYSYARNKTEKK